TSARINEKKIDSGTIQLFDGAALRDMSLGADGFPEEFKNPTLEYKRAFPKGDQFVMVRVNLGVRSISDAVAMARKRAAAVIIAGVQHARGRRGAWKESGNRIHVMDGRIVSQTLSRGADMPVTSFVLDPLAYGMEKAASQVVASKI